MTKKLLAIILMFSVSKNVAQTIEKFSMNKVFERGEQMALLEGQVGKWKVSQKMWNGKNDDPFHQISLFAERSMIGNFLQEVMYDKEQPEDFERICYLSYNNAASQWEYIVIDTRYPLMMFETTSTPEVKDDQIVMFLPSFIVPPDWVEDGDGQLARERRVVTFRENQMLVQQYWTLPGRKEFLAIQYQYDKIR